MTDERMDPRFEAAVQAALTELEPGEVPVRLRRAVAAVARPRTSRWSGPRLVVAAPVVAALVVAVVALGVATRFDIGVPNVGVAPSATPFEGPPTLHVVLTTDDDFAPRADIVTVLEDRLEAVGHADARVSFDEGQFTVDVEADEADREDIQRLLTTPGHVEGLAIGVEAVEPGVPVAPSGYPVLFDGEDIASAELSEDADAVTIQLLLDSASAALFGDHTRDHVGEYFAIAIDGVPVIVPSINEPILEGDVQIGMAGGESSLEQARELVAILRSGALPASLALAGREATPSPIASPSPAAGSRLAVRATIRGECGSRTGCAYEVVVGEDQEAIRAQLTGDDGHLTASMDVPIGFHAVQVNRFLGPEPYDPTSTTPRSLNGQCEFTIQSNLGALAVLDVMFTPEGCQGLEFEPPLGSQPATVLDVEAEVPMFCGSIGGCDIEVIVTGDGDPINVPLARAESGLVRSDGSPIMLAPGTHVVTFNEWVVSDEGGVGRIGDEPMITCNTTIEVAGEPFASVMIVVDADERRCEVRRAR